MPDDELLAAAEARKLSDKAVFMRRSRRMLDDPRSGSIADDFAGQWWSCGIWIRSNRTQTATCIGDRICARP
jgi:hypothetical protein